MVSSGVREIVPAVVVGEGVHHPADVVLWGTGFLTTEFLVPMQVTGPDGASLASAWQDGASAYLGICVSGFPNLFLLYGPNTNLGHNSIIFMLEAQIGYVVSALKWLRDRGKQSVEVRAERQQAFDAEMQERLARSVWASGCGNWYGSLGEGGRTTGRARRSSTGGDRRIDPDDYVTR